MNDDYLWDRSGPPDEEIAALERVLAPLGHREPPASRPPQLFLPRRTARAAWVMFPLAAAATLALAVVPLRLSRAATPSDASWTVVEVEGPASIGAKTVGEKSTLSAGQSLRTGARGRVAIEHGMIGHLDIGPSTEVTLVPSAAGRHRFHLGKGALSALIWADPGQFFVDTHSSTAIDLGCAYTLTVDAQGGGELRVTTGWVGFQMRDRQALIPAGAMCRTRPGLGPGTPYMENAPAALRSAIDVIDTPGVDAAARAAALDRVLESSRPEDAFTLWHLLPRLSGGAHDRVYDRLAQLVPPPPGVTRDGIRSGDAEMLELWWDRLGLGDTAWWHLMSRPWSEPVRR